MNFILWIIFGAIVGWVASIVMGTNSRQGLIGDIVVGIIGALIGGLVMDVFGQPGVTGFNIYSAVVAVIGAMILIWGQRQLAR